MDTQLGVRQEDRTILRKQVQGKAGHEEETQLDMAEQGDACLGMMKAESQKVEEAPEGAVSVQTRCPWWLESERKAEKRTTVFDRREKIETL